MRAADRPAGRCGTTVKRNAFIRSPGSLFVIAAALALLMGCTGAPTVVLPPSTSPASPVPVSRGTVTSVVTADAVVVPTPVYAVSAPVSGQIRHADGVNPGDALRAGQVVGWQGGVAVSAPVGGYFEQWLVPHGVTAHVNVPVALLRYSGFGVAGHVPPAHAYRAVSESVEARAQITNGPGPAACRLVTAADAVGGVAGDGSLPVLCLLDVGVRAYPGLDATLALTTAVRRDVLVLPVTAVAGSADRGVVGLLVDGNVVPTEVGLGVTDGVMVEIVSGLHEGDLVMPYGPNLRPAIR